MIPELTVASVPVARARFMTAPVISSICLGEKPARPSSVIREATSLAEKLVVAPKCFALLRSDSNVAPVALAAAPAARIASSKLV